MGNICFNCSFSFVVNVMSNKYYWKKLLHEINDMFMFRVPISEFTAILDHLHYFKDQLLNSVEGQSSGTFEWVDGMLVQALQSGDWLLMDNVNFCR